MKKALLFFLITFVFNTAIAGVLYLVVPGGGFAHQFVFAQSIGFSIASISRLVVTKVAAGSRRLATLAIALPIAVAIGITIASKLTGIGSWSDPGASHAWESMAIGLFFGIIGAVTFLLYERAEAETRQRRLIESESARRATEAQLKLLQAQIEPHFLFNTLANVGSLIDSDPALARRLLERLNDWLRIALARTRSDGATLGDELDMLQNYLEIMKIRFGERLRWRINVPESARRLPFPPMLLQPLVENAVRHGIEPKVGGGEVGIDATLNAGKLRLVVSNDGIGLATTNSTTTGSGTGLTNVRARLLALYGETAYLALAASAEGGTTATLELPGQETTL